MLLTFVLMMYGMGSDLPHSLVNHRSNTDVEAVVFCSRFHCSGVNLDDALRGWKDYGTADTDSLRQLSSEEVINQNQSESFLNIQNQSFHPENIFQVTPDPPKELVGFVSNYHNVTLHWLAPINNGDSSISSYQIEWSSNNSDWEQVEQVPSTVDGEEYYEHYSSLLTPNSTFYYRVRSINADGEVSQPSNVTSIVAVASTSNGIPTNVIATQVSTSEINLSWTAPTDLGEDEIIEIYMILRSENNGNSWHIISNIWDSNQLSYIDDSNDLTIGAAYGYRVQTWIHEFGTKDPSSPTFITFADVPDAPSGLTAMAMGRTTINLSWSAPSDNGGATITGYQIESSPTGIENTWSDVENDTQSTLTTYSHTSLLAGSTRHYRVRAINSIGPGASSNRATATTEMATTTDAPTGLTATADGQTTINLSWMAPINNGGSPINGYRVEASPDGTLNWSDLTQNTETTATTYVHNNLAPETTQYYQIRAINSAGTSPASNTANATTDPPTATIPDAPTGLSAASSGQTTIILSWTAPTNTGGAVISGYKIEVSPNGTSDWSDLVMNTNSATTSYEHSGLAPEMAHYYRVSAINAVGTGPASLIASATTDAPLVLSFARPISRQRYPEGVKIADLELPTAVGGTSPYIYMISEALPEGLFFDEGTRSIGGTPTQVTSVQTIIWKVTDAMGTEVTMEFSIEIYGITFVGKVENQSYTQGVLIDPLILPEVNGGIDPISYTINLLSLPTGLRFDLPMRTISGIPVQTTPPVGLTYKATDANGASDSLNFNIEVISPVHLERELPLELTVHASYPNPFTHSTRIVFDLPWTAQIQVDIMDMTGRRVYTKPAAHLSSGPNQFIELNNLTLPAGVYLYQMNATSPEGRSSVHVGYFMRLR